MLIGTVAAAALPRFVQSERLTKSRAARLPVSIESDPTRFLSVGIAASDENTSFGSNRLGRKLLIFGQRQRLRDHPIVEKAIKLARGEAQFVYLARSRGRRFGRPPGSVRSRLDVLSHIASSPLARLAAL